MSIIEITETFLNELTYPHELEDKFETFMKEKVSPFYKKIDGHTGTEYFQAISDRMTHVGDNQVLLLKYIMLADNLVAFLDDSINQGGKK